ncbi:MAG TPA: ATP-binding protein [Chroococcidiopsis sp.]
MTAIQCLRHSQRDGLIILNDTGAPIGLLRAQALIDYLFAGSAERHSRDEPFAEQQLGLQPVFLATLTQVATPISSADLWQPIAIAAQRDPTLLSPVALLPSQLSLSEFRRQLSTASEQYWVLVDASGHYVGSLDLAKVWQFLAQHPPAEGSAEDTSWQARSDISGWAILTSLPQVLEKIPLPMMVQTATGRIIVQNLAWREQFAELQDPVGLRQYATELLEVVGKTETESTGQFWSLQQDGRLPETTTAVEEEWLQEATAHSDRSLTCQLGASDGSCLCTCSSKSGQERVWQFVKVPLGAIARAGAEGTAGEQSTSEELWLVLAQDHTEQQQVARELTAKNADLVQLNRLKDEFLACISHELKTPLTAVLGLSNLLRDQHLGTLNDRQLRYAQLIYQSGRHLILIINDILDLTRIETHQLDLLLEPVDLTTICHQAYEQARQLLNAEDSHDAIAPPELVLAERLQSFEIQPGLTSLVADAVRLRQMLANLMSNALKVTRQSGEVGLKVETWEGWIAFTVWDTGIGIPIEKQHLIFQKFQQLENPLTRQFEGTGLGLVLTQRLARLHGGDVTFTSVEGKGSQFTLLLPPVPPQADPSLGHALEHDPIRLSTSNRLVVLVEAGPTSLNRLSGQLEELGYRVAIARSGTEALEKIRRLQPAIVFLNPVLPSLSGWDVLTLLKTDRDTRHIPVIVTATQAERQQAKVIGADGFLACPARTVALEAAIDRLIPASVAVEVQNIPSNLVILHLCADPSDPNNPATPAPKLDLNAIFYPYHCRILEVDDIAQADLLARVWKPDVLLVEGTVLDPLSYLKQLSQFPFLEALPVVTLTPEMTQAANQISRLTVYPCLEPLNQAVANNGHPTMPALLQVLRIATGMHWTPHVLIVNLDSPAAAEPDSEQPSTDLLPSTRPDCTDRSEPASRKGGGAEPAGPELASPELASPEHRSSDHLRREQWIQAFEQYLQTTKLRGSTSPSWADAAQQIRNQGVDLLLLWCHTNPSAAALSNVIDTLNQQRSNLPILLWDCRVELPTDEDALTDMIGAIATKTLPASISMPDLLNEIQQAIAPQIKNHGSNHS